MAKKLVIYPIEAGRMSLTLVNNPMRLIEQVIEHAKRPTFSTNSTAYPTPSSALSNAKKKGVIVNANQPP